MRSSEENPVTMGERYSLACEASNLRMSEGRGAVDLIAAAGVVPNRLASAVYRLRIEYDSVRADHQHAEDVMRASAAAADRQKDDARPPPGTWTTVKPRAAAEKAAEIRKLADAAALTAHVVILAQISSLREAKERFGAFAMLESAKAGKRRSGADVLYLAGRVLDVHLAPNCRHCAGRGFSGALSLGEKHTLCKPCKGQGHRRDWIGKTDADRGFAAHLTMKLDALLHEAQRDMRRGLNLVGQAKVKIQEAAESP